MSTVRIDVQRTSGSDSAADWLAEHDDCDEALLDRFVSLGDADAERAFREIVRRHGPMVLGVCRHTLGQADDADDAFQATFLVLAKRAGTIRDRRVLSRWLYEVAYRIAVRARSNAARRRACERLGAEMTSVARGDDYGRDQDPGWAELRPVLHEEIRRLPEKYRSAVVLCYLEGRTNEEAADLLRWPVGTVKGRLFRAREMLRSRLTRRGLALSASLLAVRLSQNAVFAEVVPAHLAEVTARAAVSVSRSGVPGLGLSASSSRVRVSSRVLRLLDGERSATAASGVGRQLLILALLLIAGGSLFQDGARLWKVWFHSGGAAAASREPTPPAPAAVATPPGEAGSPLVTPPLSRCH